MIRRPPRSTLFPYTSPARTRTAWTSSRPSPARPAWPGPLSSRRSWLPHLPGVGHARVANDLVVEVEPQCAVLDELREETRDVARVHLARVVRHGARQVERPENEDADPDDLAPRLGQLTVAARLDGEVHDQRARLHRPHGVRRDQDRKSTRL